MKKKRLRLLAWVLSLAMLCQVVPFAAWADVGTSVSRSSGTIGDDFSYEFDGGDGTAENPYKISTREQLELINKYPSSDFILTSDIDLSRYSNWTPICGDGSSCFSGTFDGNFHTISNLTIDTTDSTYTGNSHFVGLFGVSNGTIKNLHLNGVAIAVANIGSSYSHIGSIAGYGKNISNCTASGSIKVTNLDSSVLIDVGGLAGHLYASGSVIDHCKNYVNLNLDVSSCQVVAGGIVGCGQSYSYDVPSYTSDGRNDITYCDNHGEITASVNGSMNSLGLNIGGITGIMDYSTCVVDHCRNYADLSASGTSDSVTLLGIARSAGATTNCVNYGTLTGSSEACEAMGIASSHGSISNCYQVSNNIVSSNRDAFRIGGSSNISDCYALETAQTNGEVPSEYVSSTGYNGESLSAKDIAIKIKEIFPDDDPLPELSQKFTFGKDNLSFLNKTQYYFSEEDAALIPEWKKAFNEHSLEALGYYKEVTAGFLLEHVENINRCDEIVLGHNISTPRLAQLLDGMSSRVREKIVLKRLKGWGGSCYGMVLVSALRYTDSNLLPSVGTNSTYTLEAPFDRSTNTHNRDTEDLINFYYLQQYLPSHERLVENQNNLLGTNHAGALSEIISALKNHQIVPVSIHCSELDGDHEVILTRLLNENTDGSYIAEVYDPNDENPQQMTIYPTCVYDEKNSTRHNIQIEYSCAEIKFNYIWQYLITTNQMDLINYDGLSRNETLTDYDSVEVTFPRKRNVDINFGDSYLKIKDGEVLSSSADVTKLTDIGVLSDSTDTSDDFITYTMDYQKDGTPFQMNLSPESDGMAVTLVTLKDSSFYLTTTENTDITVDSSKQTVNVKTDKPGAVSLMYTQDKTTENWPWESVAIDTTNTTTLTLTVEGDGVHVSGDGLKNAQMVVGVPGKTDEIKFDENTLDEVTVRQGDDKLTIDGSDSGSTDPKPTDPTTPTTPTNPAAPSGGSGDGDSGAGALLVVGGVAAAAAITAGVVLSMPVEVQGKVELADHTPLAGAKIALLQDGKVVEQTTADDAGAFSVKVKRGEYQLTAAYTNADGQIIHQTVNIKAPAKDVTVTF